MFSPLSVEVQQQATLTILFLQWTNRDLASSPPEDRKWTQWTFLAFWTAHAAGAGSWVAGSSIIAVGLEPLSAYLCIATAHVLITILIVLNGRGPSRYHIGVRPRARTHSPAH